jgi:hypothetical protein
LFVSQRVAGTPLPPTNTFTVLSVILPLLNMKNHIKNISFIAVVLLAMAGCKQSVSLAPSLDVKVASGNAKVNEKLLFEIGGNPDFLVFYSGETGKEYSTEKFGGGVTIKGMDTKVETFTFSYPVAGTYTATFVGSTSNVYEKQEVIKRLQIVVSP